MYHASPLVRQRRRGARCLQVGPVGFVFNYTFNVTNNNYLSATLSDGCATVSFTDITDEGEEQAIIVFDGEFASTTVEPRTTQTVHFFHSLSFVLFSPISILLTYSLFTFSLYLLLSCPYTHSFYHQSSHALNHDFTISAPPIRSSCPSTSRFLL